MCIALAIQRSEGSVSSRQRSCPCRPPGHAPCTRPPPRGARAPAFVDPPGYARHRPETTLLYQLVEQHYPPFRELRAVAGRPLPDYVEAEFDAYLKCDRLEEGFLRLRCEHCHAEKLVAFSCKKRGFYPSCGARRFLLPTRPSVLSAVLSVIYRTISGHLLSEARLTRRRCSIRCRRRTRLTCRPWSSASPNASLGCWRIAA